MTRTHTPSAAGRWRHVSGHLRYALWLAFHPGAPLPEGPLNIPVPPGERGARLLALKDIADRLGVTEAEQDGVIAAERRWGLFRVRAHLVARDYTRQLAMAGVIRKNPDVLTTGEIAAVCEMAGSSFPRDAA